MAAGPQHNFASLTNNACHRRLSKHVICYFCDRHDCGLAHDSIDCLRCRDSYWYSVDGPGHRPDIGDCSDRCHQNSRDSPYFA